MPDGIDADVAEMDACAQALSTAGATLGALGGDAGGAAAAAGGGVLAGPLTGAIDALIAELQSRTQTLGAAVTATGRNVGAAAQGLRTTDVDAATILGRTVSGGTGGPLAAR